MYGYSEFVLSIVGHVTSIVLTVCLLGCGIGSGFLRRVDHASLIPSLFVPPLLYVASFAVLHRRPVESSGTIVSIWASIVITWSSKSGLIFSSANMLKVSCLHGVRYWMVGLVPTFAGVVYAAVASAVCEPNLVPASVRVYQCSPSKIFMVSLVASEILVDIHIAVFFYELLFEGFTLSLRAISLHKARSIVLILSILSMMAANTIFSVQFIIGSRSDDLPLLRVLNFSPVISIFSAQLPSIANFYRLRLETERERVFSDGAEV